MEERKEGKESASSGGRESWSVLFVDRGSAQVDHTGQAVVVSDGLRGRRERENLNAGRKETIDTLPPVARDSTNRRESHLLGL